MGVALGAGVSVIVGEGGMGVWVAVGVGGTVSIGVGVDVSGIGVADGGEAVSAEVGGISVGVAWAAEGRLQAAMMRLSSRKR